MKSKKIKVLIAHPGLDSHWIGSIYVARCLMEAGMEVVYLGNAFAEAIVNSAIEEDVNILGLSILSGSHLTYVPEICQLLRDKNARDMPVIVGGTISWEDAKTLKMAGVTEVFNPGTLINDIVKYIEDKVKRTNQDKVER